LLLSLARLIQENASKPPKKWLKSHEVMSLLHVSHGTLYSMRSSGALPFKKIGNILYYYQEEINRLLLPGRPLASAGGRPFRKNSDL
jgi:predicted DNA-binding transcriptional regulator AlpA